MKKILAISCACLIFNTITFCDDTPFEKKNSFKINPFSLLDWHNQAFTIAFERSFNYNGYSPFSWQIEGGAIMANYVFPNEHYTGIKARGDLRYNFKSKSKIQFYGALNSGYTYTNYKTLMTYIESASGNSTWTWSSIAAYRLKPVEFDKNVVTVNMILGFNRLINSKLYIDIYAGLGTRKTKITTPTENYYMPGWNPLNYYDMRGYYIVPGKFNYPNFTAGMKFCFIID
ncbi:MAG: hypothetical protein HUU47_06875 [Bacteroidetes bacterium]|nr:hypothetical protein [Bacteroidota bacterium]